MDLERWRLAAEMRHRVGRVGRGLRDVKGEREVLLERVREVGLGVLEVEHRSAAAAGGVGDVHLGRERQRAVLRVRGLVRVAVGRVELGGDVRVVRIRRAGRVAGDRRVGVGARERAVDRVVLGVGLDLEARAVEQQLGGRVVVDEELEADALEEADGGLRLGLGRRAGAAEGLRRRVGRGALVVKAPVAGVVAVGVDAVARRDLPVAVVVVQVLAPLAVAGRERVVVAVGVGDRQDPDLARVDEARDLGGRHARDVVALRVLRRAALAVVVDEEVGQAARLLGGDPLAGVLRGHVQRGGAGAVGVRGLARVARDAQRDDRLAVDRVADDLALDDVRVLVGEARVLLVERLARRAARNAADGADVRVVEVGPVDVVAAVGVDARRAPAGVALQARVEAELAQALRLLRGRDDLDAPAARALGQVEALLGEQAQGLAGLRLDAVGVQARGRGLRGAGDHAETERRDEGGASDANDKALHVEPPGAACQVNERVFRSCMDPHRLHPVNPRARIARVLTGRAPRPGPSEILSA